MALNPPNIIYFALLGAFACLVRHVIAIPSGAGEKIEVKLEPEEVVVSPGETVTFLCSSTRNVTFQWIINDDPAFPYKIIKGVAFYNGTSGLYYWSKLTLVASRILSGEVTCIAGRGTKTAFLKVNGVQIGGACTNTNDCVTDKATCQNGICECPENQVLLRLTKSGYEVCREMIYRLYEPCEFSEQCFHLVDTKSVCAANGICVCAAWATDVNGKCVSKGEMSYNKNQELYRVGLVAITCLIIVIVSISLWITMKKSCREENVDGQRRAIAQNAEADRVNDVIMEISEDKPPSYDDVLETPDNVVSPPDFKDALKHSMTAKRLLRQVSAPAGQLLSRTTSLSLNSSKKNSNTSRKGS